MAKTEKIITVTAAGIVRDYVRRGIASDTNQPVKQGHLQLWVWNNSYVGRLVMGKVEYTSPYSYQNVLLPQDIANDIYARAGGDVALTTTLFS